MKSIELKITDKLLMCGQVEVAMYDENDNPLGYLDLQLSRAQNGEKYFVKLKCNKASTFVSANFYDWDNFFITSFGVKKYEP